MAVNDNPSPLTRVLEWLRAGYPTGIPRGDYVPLLGVLHRKVTKDEIRTIVDELTAQSDPGEPVSADEIRAMVEDTMLQEATAKDISRVSKRLQAAGWELAVTDPQETDSFAEMSERAKDVRAKYAARERARYGREWTTTELALGLVGDVGDLVKLVQAKAGIRKHGRGLDEALEHELSDILWAVMTLASEYDIDLAAAFATNMAELETELSN